MRSYTEEEYNKITAQIIEAAIEVHKELGPGLLESVYEVCLIAAMKERGFYVQRQLVLPVHYKGQALDKDFMIDVLVNDLIVLELKSVEGILPIHEAQLVPYLKLSNKKLGLLINFNVPLLKEGIRRKINGNLKEQSISNKLN